MVRLFPLAGFFCLFVSTSICPAQTRGLTTVLAEPGDRSPDGRIASPEDFALAVAFFGVGFCFFDFLGAIVFFAMPGSLAPAR